MLKSRRTISTVAGLVVLILAVVLTPAVAVAPAGAQTDTMEGEQAVDVVVRITAKRLADGRIEFGLQPRAGSDSWGERQLPARRFFPANATVDRWLSSSPLTLGGAGGATVQVRITARRVADGRVEFALQTRTSGGDWGERLLPRSRYFPTSARAGRWLSSSPLTPGGAAQPPATAPTTTTTTWRNRTGLAGELDRLVLAGANNLRAGLPPLQLDAGLTAAAQARATQMATTFSSASNFDFFPWLHPAWDTWKPVGWGWSTGRPSDPRMAPRLRDSLVLGPSASNFRCALCTHLGVGVATWNGRTYATAVVAGHEPSASLMRQAERQMVDLTNNLRARDGLSRLAIHEKVAEVALRWTRQMGATQNFEHNPDYYNQYPRQGRRRGAENINFLEFPSSLSAAVQELFATLVASPDHYKNIVDPDFTHIGIGLVIDAGRIWVTQNFAKYV